MKLSLSLPHFEGNARSLFVGTFAYAFGRGIYSTASIVFFTLSFGLSATQIGVALSGAGVAAFCASMPAGYLADRWGPRRMAIVVPIAQGMLLGALMFTHSYLVVLPIMIALGAAERTNSIARRTLIAHVISKSSRVRAQAFMRSTANTAMALGALATAPLLAAGTRSAFLASLGISLGAYLVVSVATARLPKPNHADHLPVEAHLSGRLQPPGQQPEKLKRRLAAFASLGILNGLLALHISVLDVALPLWLTIHTDTPKWLIAALVFINTILAILLQVPASRGAGTVQGAAKTLAVSGLFTALACILLATTASQGGLVLIATLGLATVVLTAGELLQSAGEWGLSYELAPTNAQGRFIGAFSLGITVQEMIGPTLVVTLALTYIPGGWLILSAVLMFCAALVIPMTRWVARLHVHQETHLSHSSRPQQPEWINASLSPTLHHSFTEIALRRPNAPALIDEDGTVTYGDLRIAASEVTAELASLVTDDDRLLAARFSRGRCAPIGILGILGVGRGYVPVDPDYPVQRRMFLLDDSGARLLLTDGRLEADETPLARVGDITIATRQLPRNRPVASVPDGTAYVIYTSGSTGTPKGCVVGNAQVLALLDACGKRFRFLPNDVWTLFHSFSFDFSIWELWGALLNGGTAVLLPKRVTTDPDALVDVLAARRITVLSQTPSMFGFLVQQLSRHKRSLPDLRYVVLGGEAVNLQDSLRWFEEGIAPRAQLINMYGITETTVHVTYRRLDAETCRYADSRRTPIGQPLPHLRVSLRDSDGRPVADGTPGEIWVAGAGVSSGYLGRAELTRERFIRDGAHGTPCRYYRSGDWAVRGADGDLHYIGRIDDQIKIRGHRIELGEVEAMIEALDGVKGAACTAQTNRVGQRVLVAYVAIDAESVLDARSMRAQLDDRLPAQMRPHVFKHVAGLPITANGKLDRAALPTLPILDWPTSRTKG
ncbi:amino acid adenylation domain-containing protein [Salinispora arenicola]|uniref:amino acid adenylation domain-containing protein n=1 Tax=Salinispora arenicola TaxID=168697 RepID=UPI0003AA8573|nr:amino acid adenylation domain-containing protein [Salinispora arenicola]NIL59741.1 amino acid adenylation domain-containing protein [Salinispora arenicola]NIL64679.1 amino acid adenylation domain-containing protein [Salinispora arenicola]